MLSVTNKSMKNFAYTALKSVSFAVKALWYVIRTTVLLTYRAVLAASSFLNKHKDPICVGLFVGFTLALYLSLYLATMVAVGSIIYLIMDEAHNNINAIDEVQNKEHQDNLLRNFEPDDFEPDNRNGYESDSNIEFCEDLARDIYTLADALGKKDKNAVNVEASITQKGFSEPKFICEEHEQGLYIMTTKNANRLFVIARGTSLSTPDGSIMQDVDPKGPGFTVFENNKEKILKSLNPALGFTKAQIKEARGVCADDVTPQKLKDTGVFEKAQVVTEVNLSGHSLGGAHSMYMLLALLEQIQAEAESDVMEDDRCYTHINKINVALFQSAGVNRDVAQKVKDLMEKLEASYPYLVVNVAMHIHAYDWVPESGVQVLGDYDGKNANVWLVKRHLSWLTCLRKVLGLDFFLGHRQYFYQDDDNAESVMQEYIEDKAIIAEAFNSEKLAMFRGEVLHKICEWIGPSNFVLLRDVLLFMAAITALVVNVVLLVVAPCLSRFLAMYVCLMPAFFSGTSAMKSWRNKYPAPAKVPTRTKSSSAMQGPILNKEGEVKADSSGWGSSLYNAVFSSAVIG